MSLLFILLTTLIELLRSAPAPAAVPTPRSEMHGKLCLGTRFCASGDQWCGRSSSLGRRIRPTDWGIAMRPYRYGTVVRICYPRSGLCIIAPVIDHGPYMAVPNGCNWKKREEYLRCRKVIVTSAFRSPRPGWKYTGCIDMTPAVTAALKHPGWGYVKVKVISRPRRVALHSTSQRACASK